MREANYSKGALALARIFSTNSPMTSHDTNGTVIAILKHDVDRQEAGDRFGVGERMLRNTLGRKAAAPANAIGSMSWSARCSPTAALDAI